MTDDTTGAGTRKLNPQACINDLQAMYEWLREPDHNWGNRPSRSEMIAWLNRRPCATPLAAQAMVTALQAENAALRETLEPFSTFGITEDGEDIANGLMRDRICDWFGPADFNAARALKAAGLVHPDTLAKVTEEPVDILAGLDDLPLDAATIRGRAAQLDDLLMLAAGLNEHFGWSDRWQEGDPPLTGARMLDLVKAEVARAREGGWAKALEAAARVALEDHTPAYGIHRADMECVAETQRYRIAKAIRALSDRGAPGTGGGDD